MGLTPVREASPSESQHPFAKLLLSLSLLTSGCSLLKEHRPADTPGEGAQVANSIDTTSIRLGKPTDRSSENRDSPATNELSFNGPPLNLIDRSDFPVILIGGGARPEQAMSTFIRWAGGASGNILVITWAAPEHRRDAYFASINSELLAGGAGNTTHISSIADLEQLSKNSLSSDSFEGKLADVTGVFLSGGDQAVLMAMLNGSNFGRELASRIMSGSIVIGTTSAGSAVASRHVIYGGTEKCLQDHNLAFDRLDRSDSFVIEGLGLFDGLKNQTVIIDQHFGERKRIYRMQEALICKNGTVGLGVEEDGAAIFVSRSQFMSSGTGVFVVSPETGSGGFRSEKIAAGLAFDLNTMQLYDPFHTLIMPTEIETIPGSIESQSRISTIAANPSN